MNEYKIIKSKLHWNDNLIKFEEHLNSHATQGWEVVGFSVVGDQTNNFVALLKKSKHR